MTGFLLRNTKEDIFKNVFFVHKMKVNRFFFLLPNVHSMIFVCVLQKIEHHTGLERHDGR